MLKFIEKMYAIWDAIFFLNWDGRRQGQGRAPGVLQGTNGLLGTRIRAYKTPGCKTSRLTGYVMQEYSSQRNGFKGLADARMRPIP